MNRGFVCIVSLFFSSALAAQRVETGTLLPTRQTPVHDPVMIREDSTYYLFCTGQGISVWSSKDRKEWKKEKPVFEKPPAWAVEAVPGYRGHTWAPDISYRDGTFYLYYSVSAFGKNTSCIGLATNTTLDPSSKDYHWVDRGKIIQSVPGRDMWNAIDPNLARDDNGNPYLVFGSFWEGIKLVRLAPGLDSVAKPEEWYTVAARERSFRFGDSSGGNAAIEAPFIFKKNGYYYLFVSFDYCCRGENSTYRVMVGRSSSLTGPYLDKEKRPMSKGGGTELVKGNAEWHGIGHNAVYTFGEKDYMICHGYDAFDKGRSKLIIRELDWDPEGWPLLKDE